MKGKCICPVCGREFNTLLRHIHTHNSDIHNKEDFYKAFPDIGERVENGILCSSRRVNYEKAAFALKKMTSPLPDDTNYFISGKEKQLRILYRAAWQRCECLTKGDCRQKSAGSASWDCHRRKRTATEKSLNLTIHRWASPTAEMPAAK